MSFLLIPHRVSDTSATIWVGALDEENVSQRSVRLELENGGEGLEIELDASAWETWECFPAGRPKTYPPVDRLLHLASVLKAPPIRRPLGYQRVEIGKGQSIAQT